MITRKLRSFSAMLALVALCSMFAVTAQPAPAAAHGRYQNGCTAVPDSGKNYNFHNSCDRHDLCYHYKYYGNSSAGRKSCDVRFLNDMKAWCSNNPVNKTSCRSRAYVYYNGVRAAGWKFF